MSPPSPRRSTRENKGIAPSRFAMADGTQKQQPGAGTSTQQARPERPSDAQPPNETAILIANMQKEFKRQIHTLQSLITTNIEKTNSTVGQLRQELLSISNARQQASQEVPPAPGSDANGSLGESLNVFSIPSSGSLPVKTRKLYPLPKFEGLPENWLMFYEDYLATTEEFEYTDLQNIIRIREALQNPARDTVESLLSSAKNVGAIITTLKETYGRPELLIKSQILKVRQCPNIGEGKLDQLITYANKVNNMATFLKSISGEHHLANPTLLSELVSKLPISKQIQWAEKCLTLNDSPNIEQFSSWLACVKKVANMVTDALPVIVESAPRKQHNHQPPVRGNKYAMVSVTAKSCAVCNGTCEKISACKKFLEMALENRWKKIKELRHCFCCLKGNHQVSSCRFRKVCGVNNCFKNHHSLLHRDPDDPAAQPTTTQDLISCHVKQYVDEVLFQIIPVTLYNAEKSVSIYAFIDDGANATMLDWEIAKQLGLHGKVDTLKLQWLNGKSVSEQTEIVNVMISAMNEEAKYEMKRVYLTNNLELPKQSVVKRQLFPKNPHMVNMPIPEYIAAEPKMIISIAHAFLTAPIEVNLNPNENGPIVMKCKLGTVVYGPTECTSPSVKFVCHTNKVNPQDPNDAMKQMMYEYFEMESCGVKTNVKQPISHQDETALKIMEKTTKFVGDRYETGLLWRAEHIKLPNSYEMAEKRLISLENKFKKNPEFATQYCNKMDDLFKKGYAKRVMDKNQPEKSARIFYLPHFPVSNPNKKDVRIVFDAAAKVSGMSLNDALLTGPDLNKSLVSVLMKFRENPIAVVGDIKEMFLQVAIREEDRNAQRFLWRGQNFDGPIEHCVMERMLFGAACSPTIAQFIKNKNCHEMESQDARVTRAILDRHYVDDYIDCFHTENEALDVVRKVLETHKRAGFELCKIRSNSQKVNDEFCGSNVDNVNFLKDGVERI